MCNCQLDQMRVKSLVFFLKKTPMKPPVTCQPSHGSPPTSHQALVAPDEFKNPSTFLFVPHRAAGNSALMTCGCMEAASWRKGEWMISMIFLWFPKKYQDFQIQYIQTSLLWRLPLSKKTIKRRVYPLRRVYGDPAAKGGLSHHRPESMQDRKILWIFGAEKLHWETSSENLWDVLSERSGSGMWRLGMPLHQSF